MILNHWRDRNHEYEESQGEDELTNGPYAEAESGKKNNQDRQGRYGKAATRSEDAIQGNEDKKQEQRKDRPGTADPQVLNNLSLIPE